MSKSRRKKKPTRKPRHKPKSTPAIHVTINVAKKKPENSKQTLLAYDEYVAGRQRIEFAKWTMK
jgi:hypothetical protein